MGRTHYWRRFPVLPWDAASRVVPLPHRSSWTRAFAHGLHEVPGSCVWMPPRRLCTGTRQPDHSEEARCAFARGLPE